jgi:hypothetical protein
VGKITPEAIVVLARIKRYGLGTWAPGTTVISSRKDSTFVRSHERIISDLVATGLLAIDHTGEIRAALAGDHELHGREIGISESRGRVAGHMFQVVTEDWAVEADALRARKLVLGGLAFTAESDPEAFDRMHRRIVDGQDDVALEAIVRPAINLVTSHYSDGSGYLAHRVGVRAFG